MIFGISTGAIVGIVIACVLVLLLIIIIASYISIYNTLIRMVNNADEGWATIDVYLKKRYDLVPNLVETVKGYAKHESGTLEAVINARNMAMGAVGPENKMAAENVLSGTLKSLFALTESYPDLKADRQFINLQDQLQKIESEIAQSRKYYNATVRTFNTKIQVFPSNIVAKMMKLSKRVYFELDSEEERKNVKVSF